jgi:hypothetical protein
MPIFDKISDPLASRHRDSAAIARNGTTRSPHFSSRRCVIAAMLLLLAIWSPSTANAQELKYPQIIKIKYEAQDPRVGGHFIIWVEREKIWYGLDSRLYPAAKSVEVTHVTPAPGSTTITMITVTSVNSGVPDHFHLSGNVRFKISGMVVTSSNIP